VSCATEMTSTDIHLLALFPAGLTSAARRHARHTRVFCALPTRVRICEDAFRISTRKVSRSDYIIESHSLLSARLGAEDDLSICSVRRAGEGFRASRER
jgi:hypothetical protein